jgi:16S rRNA U516 pseudouridylate synthase RsuA-like enzyme
MCEAAGMAVTRLRRVAQGNLKLGDLQFGKWRYLTEEEMAELF